MAEKVVRNAEKKDSAPAGKAPEAGKKPSAPAAKKPAASAAKNPAASAAKKPVASAAKNPAPNARKAEPAKDHKQQGMTPKKSGSSIGFRIGAIVLWIAALVFELLAIMAIAKNFTIQFTQNGDANMWILLIGCIALDLICAILAAQLWKKANYISPMSEKRGKFLFYLWNELGVVMACICFIPLIVLLLKNDKLDKKMKAIVTAIAAAALLITGLASAEYHPLSLEQQQSATTAFANTKVYWTQFGHVFHLDPDKCSYIRDRDYYVGAVDEAMSSGKTRICSYCESHAADEGWNTQESVLTWISQQKTAQTAEAEHNTIGSTDPAAAGGN